MKLCKCGCGKKITKIKNTYISGHNFHGNNHPQYKGGIVKHSLGYIFVMDKSHPRRNMSGYVLEHILIAERVLGELLPKGAIVHHVDGNVSNNINSNLVICQSRPYHQLLHRRFIALRACGKANWLKCVFCKKYDDPNKLTITGKYGSYRYHKECAREYYKKRRMNNEQFTGK